jgi:hypothetical protein
LKLDESRLDGMKMNKNVFINNTTSPERVWNVDLERLLYALS